MSSIEFAHPEAWYLLLGLVPAILISLMLYRRLEKALGYLASGNKARTATIRRRLLVRTVCWCFAWILFTAAVSDPSWGTKLVPVQKYGKAASFVLIIDGAI